ncbi:type II toxin-antitoxin system HicB family antitoxin [Desulfosarcina sp. OttesenSCG-928-A07]|nr:type II toxin-antitoxin system HicB family antitoxin [Desulfosarcina sp. OttesenSCG-928-G17]MDL2328398.1 type II toxin-antitoxin system HicB family antitoxin [Desulfosarcina sp. OttesenSCG-928-A07]
MTVYYAGFIPTDAVYAVLFPDLPGCNTEGDTLEGAFSMAVEAIAGHIVAMADDGDDIPEPSPRAEALAKLREQIAGLGFGDLPEGTELHPVPSPNLDMRTRQVAVSFSKYKLDMIDRKARAAGMTRSGFLAAAASAFEDHQRI